ncbi:helix-turn-helix transcriptional regulator [Alkaliphilus transvaalensis]|uniref:helix-turn-helix transcriptional regulator n=1 Tax=Alkaliphilus transvaalensis TaxID=114628 RepID=UPI0004787240|nr:helix-turn-helix transcriptional regulator [Alkaliphilus transvaalensis]
MEILSAGEKIKKLRCDLGLKQDDITNEEVTKSLVSMIENNKRSLSWNTARIIAGCLNRYYSTLGKEITPEFLMETEEDQARKIIEKEIADMQPVIKTSNVDEKLVDRSFEKMMDLANSWGLEKEIADLYILKGDYYYHSYQYNKGLKFYSDALEYYMGAKDYGKVGQIYNSIGISYLMMMLYDQALIYLTKAYDMAQEHATNNQAKRKAIATFNLILCNRYLQKHDLALQYISLYKDLKSEDPSINHYLDKVLLIEANTHRDLKNFERAEKLYMRLLNRKEKLEVNTLFLVYENCAELYRELNRPEHALDHIDKAFEFKDRVNENYLPSLYLQQAKCYMLLGENERIMPILNNGLMLAERVAKKDLIINLHFAAVQAYISMKDYQNSLIHLQKAERMILDQNIETKKNELYSFYVEVYFLLEENQKSMEYVAKMRGDYLH